MSKHMQVELERLQKKLLDLSANVEESVNKAVLSLARLDVGLAKEVIKSDEAIDLMEVEVEEECLKILALHQPVAIDLRYIVAALKINNDLERIADLSVNIAERALGISGEKTGTPPFDFSTMAGKTRAMLRDALDSLIKMDAELANQVCDADDEVDEMNRKMYQTVYSRIRENPDQVEFLIHYLSVSRHLERIADYATNIAEDVIYMIEGTIVRHHPQSLESASLAKQ